ncbi:MBOAT family protein [Wandonia haliotis]|uniref:MBOAT family protein n=1 Tax=Wandonia haliotis TaxID=574963 RepID=A0ABN1MKS2_9FLAO
MDWLNWNEIWNYLSHVLSYNPSAPMIFTRFSFWGFFIIAYAVYAIVYKKIALRNGYLFLISLFFYYKTSEFFFFLLLFSTVTDFYIGNAVYRSTSKRKRLWLVVLSVTINLGVLVYFKYAYFFTESYNQVFHTDYEVFNHLAHWSNEWLGTGFDVNKIILPVGISFFTFQTISYTVDIYRERIQPVKNLIDFGFYVSFFPQLVAGPIVRANEFVPQIYQPYSISKRVFGMAVFLILNGLVKKMVLGDYIAVNFIDRVFDNPGMYTGFESMLALFGYSLQVYCDFSGYTDIAIGVAMLMGFYLPTNFNSPYKAQSTSEFWGRWHISLSTWLKDYLYIPLGGNRNSTWGTWISLTLILTVIVLLSGNMWFFLIFAGVALLIVGLAHLFPGLKKAIIRDINLMITMLYGGLWHGASWNFVIWGGLNGLGVVWHKYWSKISPFKNKSGILVRIYAITFTFVFITFTRIFFRAEDLETVEQMWHSMQTNFQLGLAWEILTSYKWVFFAMLFGFIVHWLPTRVKDWYKELFVASPMPVKAIVAVITVFVIIQFISSDLQPFIYFQF